jgi:hypothetical protein
MWPCNGKRPKICLNKLKQLRQLTDAAVFFYAMRGAHCKFDFDLAGF